MEDLRRAVELVRVLAKVQRTVTFPTLGVPDDRRATLPAETNDQVRLRRRLSHRDVARIFGPDRAGPTPLGHDTSGGFSSPTAQVAVTRSNVLRAKTDDWQTRASSHRNDELSTGLHEDMHQVFTRVRQRYGTKGARALAFNLLQSMPKDSREAAEAFARWKNPSYDGNHEETLTNILSYLNNPEERRSFRVSHMGFMGDTPWLTGKKARRAGATVDWGISHPDKARQSLDPRHPSRDEPSEFRAALAHDQAMKRALRHLQRIAPQVTDEWASYHGAHDPELRARIGDKYVKPIRLEDEGRREQARPKPAAW